MALKDKYKILEFADLGDERGNLVVIEGDGRDIPSRVQQHKRELSGHLQGTLRRRQRQP